MIPVFNIKLDGNELKYVQECLTSGWISSQGDFIKRFEEGFASYCGVKYGVATNNGTTALHLALVSLGIKEGHEVIVPNFTMISSAKAVCYTGATPVFVEADPVTYNIDVSKIEEKITPKTKAIMVVHIYGHPCEMDEVHALAKKHNLYVIEDAAEAHGAEYKGKRCGSLSDVACFSFYANKLITTGEGGMVVTNNKEIYDTAQSLKNLAFGKEKRYYHEKIGYNYRMTNVQAAIGVAQLEKIDQLLRSRVEKAAFYSSLLKGVKGVVTPHTKAHVKNSHWMYAVRFTKDFGMSRDDLKKKLVAAGIDTRDFFVPMNDQPIFKEKGYQTNESFPVSKELSETGLYLPFGLDITEDQIKYVCETIKNLAPK